MPDIVLVRVLVECTFVSVVTELETYRIYEVVLCTINIVTHNLSGGLNFIA
jgi:hypothetical protein